MNEEDRLQKMMALGCLTTTVFWGLVIAIAIFCGLFTSCNVSKKVSKNEHEKIMLTSDINADSNTAFSYDMLCEWFSRIERYKDIHLSVYDTSMPIDEETHLCPIIADLTIKETEKTESEKGSSSSVSCADSAHVCEHVDTYGETTKTNESTIKQSDSWRLYMLIGTTLVSVCTYAWGQGWHKRLFRS